MPIRFSGLELLTPEQQLLLKDYALYDTLLETTPHDIDFLRARVIVQDRLIRMGLYPCYDNENDCYTCIVG